MRSIIIKVCTGLSIEQKEYIGTFIGSFLYSYIDKWNGNPLYLSARFAAHLEVNRFKYL
jgi:hypothetical protein